MTESRTPHEIIRDLRQQKYPGQQVKAAQDAGLSQPYLSQLETGKRELTAQAALKIERGWMLDEYELLRWVGTEPATSLRSAGSPIPGYVNRWIYGVFPPPLPKPACSPVVRSPIRFPIGTLVTFRGISPTGSASVVSLA